ncbi:ABC transporter ATP-binding protein [Ligilactobacillus equi]|uniref:ABC transporter, ATP-binding protein n=1 Tax=Ligilactobacillus equi DPC 6820 TaxID=1392007 RepID=V7HYK0_9LACO|nr:ABC transporter ATP-binding protein [Ligilactobacillus equi]ETA74947.1 ABC transporter, ATP-binding protein [Ligilactobacillus equi DPC 6820]
MLEVKNLNKYFGKQQVLKEVTFQVASGSIMGLIGKNGSGKTTTFHCALNFLDYQGQIRLNGEKISKESYEKIGYLPEERSLMPKLTVFDQVRYLANLKGISTSQVQKQLPLWMERLQVVGKIDDKIKSLSKGNQQKIQLIATLLHQPDFIILDEPFSGLDPVNTEILKQVILSEQARGATIIFSDHSMNNVEELCDDVVMINQGQVVLDGPIQSVRESFGLSRLFVRAGLTAAELAKLPGVAEVNLEKSGAYRLELSDPSQGQTIFQILAAQGPIRTFDQQPPTLDEIFKLKAGVEM